MHPFYLTLFVLSDSFVITFLWTATSLFTSYFHGTRLARVSAAVLPVGFLSSTVVRNHTTDCVEISGGTRDVNWTRELVSFSSRISIIPHDNQYESVEGWNDKPRNDTKRHELDHPTLKTLNKTAKDEKG